ncbi:hypothetical protein KEJ15_07635 [Candidatus Bathyarchaeota archaeon]|nr:hypothetical protein [Candidatus Bathyarchaeota archaeon]
MNRKMLVLAIAIASLPFIASLATAQVTPSRTTVWTDKPLYSPGEKGTIYLAFYNDRTSAVEVKNITLRFANWLAYVNGAWVGNQTFTYTGKTISSKSTLIFELPFTVPSDGRAVGTTAYLEIGTDHGFESDATYIALYESSRYMDQIVTIFTVQIVLIIVCTFILAAVIFLAARRPPPMWKAEGKTE